MMPREVLLLVKRDAVPLLKSTVTEWQRHNAPQLAAGLSYFTIFSIAPLLIVVIEIVGFFVHSHAEVRHEIFSQIAHSVGRSGAQAIQQIVDATFSQPHKGIIAQVISWFVFLLGAIGLFGALQAALNTVWDVPPQKRSGLWMILRQRVVSFGMILGIAFLLLVSLIVNTALTGFEHALASIFPGFEVLMKVVDFIISLGVITLLFALIYRYLPDATIAWRDVWIGALITAVLFDIGQFLLGWYLGRATVASAYGAFGSLIVVLIWVNYSAQILLFGAEFTHVFARTHGSLKSAEAASASVPVPAGGAAGTPQVEGRIVHGRVTPKTSKSRKS
jgi:membrane protein